MTTDQYKLELDEINLINNTNIILKEGIEYINRKTKLLHICSCGKDWLVNPRSVLSGSRKCGLCYTFAECGIDNFGEEFLEEYWDYKTNDELGIDPWKISYKSDKKVYIFCKKVDYHGSYPISCINFTSGHRCIYCGNRKVHSKDSFGQFLIDSFDLTTLETYWDYNNNIVDPFKIATHSEKKVFIKCQIKDYHSSYPVMCSHFVVGNKCPYCNGKKYIF